jgi:hypothetical protein
MAIVDPDKLHQVVIVVAFAVKPGSMVALHFAERRGGEDASFDKRVKRFDEQE